MTTETFGTLQPAGLTDGYFYDLKALIPTKPRRKPALLQGQLCVKPFIKGFLVHINICI